MIRKDNRYTKADLYLPETKKTFIVASLGRKPALSSMLSSCNSRLIRFDGGSIELAAASLNLAINIFTTSSGWLANHVCVRGQTYLTFPYRHTSSIYSL